MSLIIPANTLASGGFAIDNSCRFNIASSDDLRRTFSSGDRKTWTWSSWIKRATLGANQSLFSCHTGDSDTAQLDLKFDSGDTISYEGKNTVFKTTSRVFRDTSAFYHIMFVLDMTQATASNRMKFYVNGVLETSFATDNTPARNTDLGINQNSQHAIGMKDRNTDAFFGGYLAETVFINAAALAPTDFGEFDEDSGIWKPIDVSGLTPSTNGFYLDYKDSSSLGNDVYGSNNFTVSNLTAIDQSTDTCTNNFATMNPLDNFYAGSAFSEGNLKIVSGSNPYAANSATIGLSKGKWYWEIKVSSTSNEDMIGIRGDQTTSDADYLGSSAYDYAYNSANGKIYNNGSNVSYGATYGTNNIISIALDLDSSTNTITFYKDGASQGASNITNVSSTTFGLYFPSLSDFVGGGSGTYEANFGSPPYAISSGNADGDGYGNFE